MVEEWSGERVEWWRGGVVKEWSGGRVERSIGKNIQKTVVEGRSGDKYKQKKTWQNSKNNLSTFHASFLLSARDHGKTSNLSKRKALIDELRSKHTLVKFYFHFDRL